MTITEKRLKDEEVQKQREHSQQISNSIDNKYNYAKNNIKVITQILKLFVVV